MIELAKQGKIGWRLGIIGVAAAIGWPYGIATLLYYLLKDIHTNKK